MAALKCATSASLLFVVVLLLTGSGCTAFNLKRRLTNTRIFSTSDPTETQEITPAMIANMFSKLAEKTLLLDVEGGDEWNPQYELL
jgi:hypothetical protein